MQRVYSIFSRVTELADRAYGGLLRLYAAAAFAFGRSDTADSALLESDYIEATSGGAIFETDQSERVLPRRRAIRLAHALTSHFMLDERGHGLQNAISYLLARPRLLSEMGPECAESLIRTFGVIRERIGSDDPFGDPLDLLGFMAAAESQFPKPRTESAT